MDELAQRFEEHRPRLRAVAHRVLGSSAEAEDAVQEAWLRLSRTDPATIDNLGGWLTTVVGRICLDLLRSRGSRREEPMDETPVVSTAKADPEEEALLADSVGMALLVVLETLTPAERLAFVLHDLFAVSYDEIAAIVGRNEATTRQLASRARRRVQGGGPVPDADQGRRREIVDAFLAAARNGEFATLLSLLDPDVVMRADEAAVRLGGTAESRGATLVAGFFNGRAEGALPASIDGVPGAVVASPAGQVRIALSFTVLNGRIIGIEAVADPDRLRELDINR